MGEKKSAYEQATDTLLAQLEAGVIPWRKPWVSAGLPKNLISHKEYRGLNVFLLLCQNYPSPYWLTFNQSRGLGSSVKKGEHGTHIMFWSTYNKKTMTHDDESGEDRESTRRTGFWRSYVVFNIAQCEGLAEKLGLNKPQGPIEDLPAAQAIWDNYPDKPTLKDADCAFYRPSEDLIGVPPRTSFEYQCEYYSTLLHEAVHSTGHVKRVNREGVMEHHAFGDAEYSAEELVAEFGSSMLCGVAGIAPALVENQASYINHWLMKLKLSDNKRMLGKAISAAQKACDHIRAVKSVSTPPEVEQTTPELVAVA